MAAPYLGDFPLSATVHFLWSTNGADGASITRSTNGTVSVYKNNGTTQSTTGVTDTEDFDSLTGVHACTIDLSADGTFYSTGANFTVTLNGATIDTKTVNAVLAHFSINNRSDLRPTTAGRTLDVSAGGEAGVDWANVGSPTTAVNLSGTTVKTATDVETDTQDLQSRTPAALVGGRMDANVGAISTDATAADNLEAMLDGTGSVTLTTAITGNITGNLSGSVGSVTGAVGSVTGAVGSVTGAVGSVTGNVGGNVTGSVGSVAAGGITAASIATGAIDADALAADAVDEIWDEVVEGSFTARQFLRLLAAAMCGELSGAATTTVVIRDASDSKTRITATVDADGNRTALSLDAT